jgi:hypothetical protein
VFIGLEEAPIFGDIEIKRNDGWECGCNDPNLKIDIVLEGRYIGAYCSDEGE